MKKIFVPAIIVIVLVIVGFVALSNGRSEDSKDSSGPTEMYSKSEVQKHNKAEDCWTIIDDKIYDITSYVPRHPGGDEILRACGDDATTLFESRTTEGGDKVGSGQPHSKSAETQLAKLAIGKLKK